MVERVIQGYSVVSAKKKKVKPECGRMIKFNIRRYSPLGGGGKRFLSDWERELLGSKSHV